MRQCTKRRYCRASYPGSMSRRTSNWLDVLHDIKPGYEAQQISKQTREDGPVDVTRNHGTPMCACVVRRFMRIFGAHRPERFKCVT